MSTASYKLPSLVGKALSILPAWPGSVLFVRGLNIALTRHLPADALDLLNGRPLRIQVKDARIAFDFVCRNGTFAAARHQGEIALTISADAYDFFLLARRAEDPDTLFFSRRLTMEGDTELGLLVKNSLDAIDFSVFSLDRFEPPRMFRRGE
ncbi:ubiquinone anaerobic biosynthesis accessory factor UbiT [Paraburkholderia adhaesiva]|uniref:ubiquinone anaerobic biosynthesis accessory factor UbiT n=1 Tax=Paraburkholderia adhaesiva TaxID=2883244 RepID=UPI001F268656|nr:SCP2 sterol-binding domain-containing protein [Paraburkholderia adhaesiva]